jgi:hypothetical protein
MVLQTSAPVQNPYKDRHWHSSATPTSLGAWPGSGPSAAGVDHEDPWLSPTRSRTRARGGSVRPPIPPLRPAQARAPDRACDDPCAIRDRPGPAAPPSLVQRPGSNPAFARVPRQNPSRVCHLNVPGPPPATRTCGSAGPVGPWPRSGVRLCEPLIGLVMCELHSPGP